MQEGPVITKVVQCRFLTVIGEATDPSARKVQDTDAPLLITSLDLKVHLRTPVVPFSTISSAGVYTSIAEAGNAPV